MPKVNYEKIQGDALLHTTMCLQLADQSLCYPKGILEDVCVRVGHSYVPADFVVVEIGGDEKSPIILGRRFLSTAKAIIYADSAKICFTIKGNKERFALKNKTLQTPAHPQKPYTYEDKYTKKKTTQRKSKARQSHTEAVRMINSVCAKYDHLLASPHLPKLDDPGVPTIDCTINQKIFYKTFYDTGSSVNIMAKVTYEFLFGKTPLYPTYTQLQMANQAFRFPKGIAREVMVKIKGHYVPINFLVLDMGEEEYDPPIILGRPFLNTTRAIIYTRSGEFHFQFHTDKVRCYFNSYTTYEQPKKNRSRRRRRSSQRHKNQPPKDGWADYEREVVKND
jgi:hypothetical protein